MTPARWVLAAAFLASALGKMLFPSVDASLLLHAIGIPAGMHAAAISVIVTIEGVLAFGLVMFRRSIFIDAGCALLLLAFAAVIMLSDTETCGCFGDLMLLSRAEHVATVVGLSLLWIPAACLGHESARGRAA